MSSTDFQKLNIVLAARDREFARAMTRNTNRIERFTRQSQKRLSKTSKSFNVLALAAKRFLPAIAAGVVVGQIKKITASMDEIGKTADNLGLSTDALQELRTVAESSGLKFDEFTKAFQKFTVGIGEATTGTGTARDAFKALGVDIYDAAGKLKSSEQVFNEASDALGGITSESERATIAADLFGQRVGVKMLNLMRNGSAGMAQMRKEAHDLGIVIDEKLIRNAEGAQTKLDLMGRVIGAQLSSALIELAPLLVVVATDIANIVRALVGGIKAVKEFLQPTSDLEIATDNIVTSMGDEIRQSQLLEAALGRSGTMSEAAAKTKLAEAVARNKNIKAIIEERRALALGSTDFEKLSKDIGSLQGALNSQGFPSIDVAVPRRADAFEGLQQQLADALIKRQALLDSNQELSDQAQLTEKNIKTLEEALANASNGIVAFGGDLISPIERTHRLGAAASTASNDLTDLGQASMSLAEIQTTLNSTFEDSFVSAITRARSFQDILKSLGMQLAEMEARKAFQQIFGGLNLGGGLAKILGFADGGVISGGNVTAFASGGVVNGPTNFPMRGGAGLMGEAGPEAIMPLKRGSDGKLGVASNGRGTQDVRISLGIFVKDDGKIGVIARQEGARAAVPVTIKIVEDFSNNELPSRLADIKRRS